LRVAEGELQSSPSTTRIRKKSMVSAVSSQAATLNPLAYTALDGDDNAKQPASNATRIDSDRGPATQVSLSQDALDRLLAAAKQGPDAARQAMDAWSQAGGDRLAAIQAEIAAGRAETQKLFAAAKDKMRDNAIGWLKMTQDSYAKWQNATPVPAVQLTDVEIDAILKKVEPRGIDPSKIGGADTYSFGEDGKIYTFRKDGTAWVNEGGVPTSEEQKEWALQSMANNIKFLTNYLRDNGTA
jgi:hypothetical protein